MSETLTLRDLHNLVYLDQSLGKRVRYLPHPDSDVMEGVARHIVVSPDNPGFLQGDVDVREGYLRISGTFEHFIPVREVMGLIENQVYRIDR